MAYKILDYKKEYKGVMVFNKNKNVKIHRWYPFVEGYSREFIESILEELDYTPEHCVEPFAGSGTTGLELQHKGIKCSSFEVSPFMHLLSQVKMRNDYAIKGYQRNLENLRESLNQVPRDIFNHIALPLKSKITSLDGKTKRVNYSRPVMEGLCDIKYCIAQVQDKKYRDLFTIVLGSILQEVGNLYRNGKCMSYKKEFPTYDREDVKTIFLNRLDTEILEDIEHIVSIKHDNKEISNWKNIRYGDVRKTIKNIDDQSCDLIITSPPYLNSRDYTDTYMMELWVLDLVSEYEDVRNLRKRTIRSHVQISWETPEALDNKILNDVMKKIEKNEDAYWNRAIPNMIVSYFHDMDMLFEEFSRIVKPGKNVYWNVANSAYFGVEVPTDIITAQIAEKHGFEIIEIREAREVRTSSQQKDKVGKLRESVTVMRKPD
jgi:DNA modification methylase